MGLAALAINTIFELNLGSDGVDAMTWEYRVVFSPVEEGSDDGEYSIREVYFDDEGEIAWWGEEAAIPYGETFEEFCDDFDMMAEAFDKPVLILNGDELTEDDSEEVVEDESEEESE